jgi:hypothetical protein
VLKNAIGSCLCTGCEGEKNEGAGEAEGEGAENRSRGRPPAVMADDEEEAVLLLLAVLSEGRERPPSPDIDICPSSSANASNEIKSAAFLLGLWLFGSAFT